MIVNHPAAGRNAEPLYDVVRRILLGFGERRAQVLELASGPGQHVELFASRHPDVQWQPTEPQALMRASIDARVAEAGLSNVRAALELDVCAEWPVQRFDLIMTVNLLHISPWSVTEALVVNAAKVATTDAVMLIYGPFRRGGVHTSDGNVAFDAELRAQNANWGIRDMEAVTQVASESGWVAAEVVSMPANNFCLVFEQG